MAVASLPLSQYVLPDRRACMVVRRQPLGFEIFSDGPVEALMSRKAVPGCCAPPKAAGSCDRFTVSGCGRVNVAFVTERDLQVVVDIRTIGVARKDW